MAFVLALWLPAVVVLLWATESDVIYVIDITLKVSTKTIVMAVKHFSMLRSRRGIIKEVLHTDKFIWVPHYETFTNNCVGLCLDDLVASQNFYKGRGF